MFENLSDKLQRSFKTLRGQGTISDENISDALREIRLARDTARFQKSSQPPSVILMAGLQGSGKTTTSGKLAQWLKKAGHRPMLVSVDVYRPAAREQLAIVARSTNSQIYEGKITEEKPGTDAVLRLAKEAKREAANYGCDMLIV